MHDNIAVILQNKNFQDLNPVDLGYEKCRSGHYFGPFIREYYLIHYVCSGKGVFDDGRNTYSVKKGEAFLIRPGELTVYTADKEDPWEYIWIGFNGKQAERFAELSTPILDIPSKIFYDMKECTKWGDMAEEILVSLLFRLTAEIFKKTDRRKSYVEQVANYVENYYMKPLCVEEIAHMLSVNRRYLSRLFKSVYGMGIQEYIIYVRISKAKLLLKQGFSVANTATMVGYSDCFNFSKMFKKLCGVSPKSFQTQTEL